MGRDQFIAERRGDWAALETILSGPPLERRHAAEISRFASLYRAACADLMRARALAFGIDVTAYLDGLVSRGHSNLYGPRPYSLRAAIDLTFRAFPRTLRRRWRIFLVACSLFVFPLAVGYALSLRSEEFAFGVMPSAALREAAESYARGFAGRDVATETSMAGFYIRNNIGIAFRCFATGAIFGVGSVFFLFYNGLLIGTTIGFVSRSGAAENILTFICGHAPFELTAIVIAGTAGLRLGHALVVTGGRSRLRSVRAASRELGDLILGAAVLLVVAAAIEAFWSPSGLPGPVKWTFSAIGTAAIALFLLLGGRENA